MKQRNRVLLTLLSASFVLACLAMVMGPTFALAVNNPSTSIKQSPTGNASPEARHDDDDHLPLRHSHFTLHTVGNKQNLGYGGGPVITGTMHTYAIFWEPKGDVDTHYNALINRYFSDIGGSPLYQIARQYKQANGDFPSNSVPAASWVDHRAYPQIPVLDNNIQDEVTHAQRVNGWHSTMHNLFFVFTERNVNVCMDNTLSQCTSNGYCAYHSGFGRDTIYSALPYIASFKCDHYRNPNHDDADKTITGISHEQLEAATDPMGNAWLDSQGNEIADKCSKYYGQPDAQGADVVWNNDPYMVQKEWDNRTSSCRLTPSSHKVAPKHQRHQRHHRTIS
ncbi:MAG: hypothetical protein ABI234_12260 [Ktedonobacteraceae bacterium]